MNYWETFKNILGLASVLLCTKWAVALHASIGRAAQHRSDHSPSNQNHSHIPPMALLHILLKQVRSVMANQMTQVWEVLLIPGQEHSFTCTDKKCDAIKDQLWPCENVSVVWFYQGKKVPWIALYFSELILELPKQNVSSATSGSYAICKFNCQWLKWWLISLHSNQIEQEKPVTVQG